MKYNWKTIQFQELFWNIRTHSGTYSSRRNYNVFNSHQSTATSHQ